MIIISSDLVAQVRHAWIADQQHPQRGRRNRPIPDSERLGALLDIAFRASMVSEAGRPVRASLAWLSVHDFREQEMKRARHSELVLKFERTRPLDAALLARLGKTTRSGSSSLLVDWVEGVPAIWGMIYYRRALPTLDEIPAPIDGVHGAPDCPILSIEGTGSLLITRGDAVIGRVTRGEFSRAVPAPFDSQALGRSLHELFGLRAASKGASVLEDGYSLYGLGLLECLKYLLEHLDRTGGGALVVFIPESARQDARQHVDLPWPSTGSLELRDLIAARIRHQKEVKERQWISASYVAEAQALIRARLDALARLASLDGALLLSPDFELVGFGARLRAPSWDGAVMEGADGFGGEGRPFDVSRLGARHTSAADFAAAVPGTVAFVASADGPIRVLARKGIGPIQCWPDCRLSLLAS
jgi:sensor domain DACNV-containing protein